MLCISIVCQLIVENAIVKNPKNDNGDTPLHSDAGNGHLAICELIVENAYEKNPKNKYRNTPLQWF